MMKKALSAWCLIFLLTLPGCVTRDYRKAFSALSQKIDRKDSEQVIQQKLLTFTPLGTPRDAVFAFLTKNLRGSADIYLEPSPTPYRHPAGYSTISARLWVRYVGIFGQFETMADYVFDEHGKLVKLTVLTADAFL